LSCKTSIFIEFNF